MLTGFAIIALPTGIVTLRVRVRSASRALALPLQGMRLGRSRLARPPLPAMRREAGVAPEASRYLPHQSIHSIGSQLSTFTLMRFRRLASGSDV